jgi:hypothetical protein
MTEGRTKKKSGKNISIICIFLWIDYYSCYFEGGFERVYIYIEGEIGININGARTSSRRDVQGE